jgi:UDPglucose 6-dehydrogenase
LRSYYEITIEMSTSIKKISVIGLGKLGACVAAALASRGFQVIGYDIDGRKTEAVRRGLAPVEEPHLQETIDNAGERLKATDEIEEAIRESDASFFVLPTPSLADGSFSYHLLVGAIEAVARAVREQRKKRHLFVVSSTVAPGTSDKVLKPLLEKVLQGESGTDFGFCYNPQFIALGDAMHGLLAPELVLIGESDHVSGNSLEQVYKTLNTNSAPIERMSALNAELAKISLNCAVTMKISFVNQLSSVCSQIPGADPEIILKAIGKDRRIGSDYLKPGLGFGGPCFPRDNRLLQCVARTVGVEAALSHATDEINEDVNRRLLETVLGHCPEGGSAGVLGLAYKPFTSVVDCSPGIWLCEQLAASKRRVLAHDYLANLNAAVVLSPAHVQICGDPTEILRNDCQVLVITCPWPAYRQFFEANVEQLSGKGIVIIDSWRLVKAVVSPLKNICYITALASAAGAVSSEVAHA